MRKAVVLTLALLAFTSVADVKDIPEKHLEWLGTTMEHFVARRGFWLIGRPPPGRDFQEWFRNYAKTNAIPFSAVIFLMQEKIECEYDAFWNNAPPPDDGGGWSRRERLNASIEMLRYLNDPVSLPFLYRMSRKAEGYYRKVFEDMFYETVEKSPVAAIRATLDTPEKINHTDIDRLCEMIDSRNRFIYIRQAIGLENEDDVFQFLLENLPTLTSVPLVRMIDWGLSKRYPEYKTSSQRLAVWEKIKDFTPAPNWMSAERERLTAQKTELAELAATPPEQRTDMRQRFKNLPAPAAAEKEE